MNVVLRRMERARVAMFPAVAVRSRHGLRRLYIFFFLHVYVFLHGLRCGWWLRLGPPCLGLDALNCSPDYATIYCVLLLFLLEKCVCFGALLSDCSDRRMIGTKPLFASPDRLSDTPDVRVKVPSFFVSYLAYCD